MVVEKTLAADLNKKMMRTWKEEPRLRYRDVLAGVLVDGEVGQSHHIHVAIPVAYSEAVYFVS